MMDRMPGLHEGPPGEFLFDFDDFERLARQGRFDGHRIELIEGKFIEMTPIGDDHGTVSASVTGALYSALKATGLMPPFRVSTHGTVKIGNRSAPEPDVSVSRNKPTSTYAEHTDSVLVVEVSVSTVSSDLRIKQPLYAKALIPEFWMVEVHDRCVRVFRDPREDGTWGEETVVTEGAIRPLFAPSIQITLADLF